MKLLLVLLLTLATLHAEPAQLTLASIFTDKEFEEEKMPSLTWSKKTASYFTLEKPAKGKDGKDLVRHDAQSGEKTVIATAQALTPKNKKKPLSVDSFEFSPDDSKVLLFTNTKKVWRKNTRGDYWLLDLTTKKLTKLGGEAAAAVAGRRIAVEPDGGACGLETVEPLGEEAGHHARQHVARSGGRQRGRRIDVDPRAAVRSGDHRVGPLQHHHRAGAFRRPPRLFNS